MYVRCATEVLAPFASGTVALDDVDDVSLVRVRAGELTVALLDDEDALHELGVTANTHSLFTTTYLAALAARAALANAPSTPTEPVWLREFIERAELCAWPPDVARVCDVCTWSALVDAVALVSAAVTSTAVLSDRRHSLAVYVRELETRMARFAFDDDVVVDLDALLYVGYLLLSVRRVIDWSEEVTSPAYHALELGAERRSRRVVVTALPPARRAAIDAYVRAAAVKYELDEHREAFTNVATRYLAGTGEVRAYARLRGLGGVERPHVVDLLESRMSPDAIDYWTSTLFDRPHAAWLDDAANPLRGGASTLRTVEDLLVLYLVGVDVASTLSIEWLAYFLITHERADVGYREHVTRGIGNHLPFILQTAGEWTCMLPAHTNVAAVVRAERALGVTPVDESSRGHRAYVCVDVVTALGVWAELVHTVFAGGVLPNAADVTLAPVVRRMLV